ncbi:MAG: radical SAM family heme chaperone HemW [Clostridia bacterium]|nr:radical SAM family heme chaperone HemW [Clostridia bacterium]
MNRGLYIHFPFCEKKCFYCDFYSLADIRLKENYVDALIREIKKFDGVKIDTVFFGGGTPSLLKESELEKIMTAIHRHFKVSANAEISLEGNPMSINDLDKLSAFHALGINRLSLGVQSFSDKELSYLGRGHSSAEAVRTVLEASKHFDNISIDLMLGIPYQTMESFKKSLDTAIALPISHISLYALSVEENTVFGRKAKKGESLHLPDTDREMYLSACDTLKGAGFEHYEISNFAKENKRSRHNMKYWNAEEYIGIGASAHSYFNGERYATPASVKAFIEGAEREEVYKNTPEDRVEEFVMLSLRLSDGLDLEILETAFGVKPDDDFFTLIKELEKHGLLAFKDNTVTLTDQGFFVSNEIIVKIMESLKI